MAGSAREHRLEFGRVQAARFRDVLAVREEPVPEDLDHRLEEEFRRAVTARFPDDPVVGEELPIQGVWRGSGWLIDPIDGTTNLRAGLPWYAASIAYFAGGRPILGWVIDPARGEIHEAVAGRGATVDGRPLTLADRPSSRLVLIGRRWRRAHPDWRRHVPRSCKDRILGATALDLAWVARGILGAGAWSRTRVFDIAAGWLLLREAGAVLITDRGAGPNDSWPPLENSQPTDRRVELVAGHPDHGSWLAELIAARSDPGTTP